VLKIESRNTKGKRAVGVVRTKLKDYNSQKKSKNRLTTKSSQSSQKNINENLDQPTPDTTKPQLKQKKALNYRRKKENTFCFENL
jgi:hypothetical protein